MHLILMIIIIIYKFNSFFGLRFRRSPQEGLWFEMLPEQEVKRPAALGTAVAPAHPCARDIRTFVALAILLRSKAQGSPSWRTRSTRFVSPLCSKTKASFWLAFVV